jgi:hypothetical protein
VNTLFPTQIEKELHIENLPSFVTMQDLTVVVQVLHRYETEPRRADLTIAHMFDSKVKYPCSKEEAEYMARTLSRAARQVNEIYKLGLE